MREHLRLRAAAAILILLLVSDSSFAGVMMQGFYWNVPNGWYRTMASKAAALRDMGNSYGIDRIWFPPPSKSLTGSLSMGYDPHDYYDLGSYNQDGAVPTRFGTQSELKAAIKAFKSAGIACLADIVLNQRSGGKSEFNPNTGGNTWTDFSNTASGMCQWHYNEFHPSPNEQADEGTFSGMPDICHATGDKPGRAYYDLIHWGQWLKNPDNAGFNGGWRFDYVKGYHPGMARDFWAATGEPFSIAEYWDANTYLLDGWVSAAGRGISIFDFALYYTLQGICNDAGGAAWLPEVFNPAHSYAAKNPSRAVTFAANHDTDVIVNDKMLAYAFILTYQGYPTIFWKDYFDYGLAHGGGQGAGAGNGIVPLVWCREKLAGGAPNINILKSDDAQVIIYQSYGSSAAKPGYIVVINTNPSSWHGAHVQTDNGFLQNQILKAYAWSSTVGGQNYQPDNQTCAANGWTQVYAPPRGYAVFSVNGL